MTVQHFTYNWIGRISNGERTWNLNLKSGTEGHNGVSWKCKCKGQQVLGKKGPDNEETMTNNRIRTNDSKFNDGGSSKEERVGNPLLTSRSSQPDLPKHFGDLSLFFFQGRRREKQGMGQGSYGGC